MFETLNLFSTILESLDQPYISSRVCVIGNLHHQEVVRGEIDEEERIALQMIEELLNDRNCPSPSFDNNIQERDGADHHDNFFL